LQKSVFQVWVGLGLADQFGDHRAGRAVLDHGKEGVQLGAQVGLDVTRIGELELVLDRWK